MGALSDLITATEGLLAYWPLTDSMSSWSGGPSFSTAGTVVFLPSGASTVDGACARLANAPSDRIFQSTGSPLLIAVTGSLEIWYRPLNIEGLIGQIPTPTGDNPYVAVPLIFGCMNNGMKYSGPVPNQPTFNPENIIHQESAYNQAIGPNISGEVDFGFDGSFIQANYGFEYSNDVAGLVGQGLTGTNQIEVPEDPSSGEPSELGLIVDGNWFYLVCTWKNNLISYYLNGLLIGTSTGFVPGDPEFEGISALSEDENIIQPAFTGPNLGIGGSGDATGWAFFEGVFTGAPGDFAQAAAYDTVLDAGQILARWNAGLSGTIQVDSVAIEIIQADTGVTGRLQVDSVAIETLFSATAIDYPESAQTTVLLSDTAQVVIKHVTSASTEVYMSDEVSMLVTHFQNVYQAIGIDSWHQSIDYTIGLDVDKTDVLRFTETISVSVTDFNQVVIQTGGSGQGHNLNFTETVNVQRIRFGEATDTLSFVDSGNGYLGPTAVSQTLSFIETVTGTTSNAINQTLSFIETLTYRVENFHALQVLNFTETISLAGSTFYVSVNQTLAFTESTSKGIPLTALQLLEFTETLNGYTTLGANDTLVFIQNAIGYTGTVGSRSQNITDTLTFREMAWCNGYYGHSPVSNDIDYTLGNIVLGGPGQTTTYSVDFLTFEETLTSQHTHVLSVTDHLVFIETLGKQAELYLPVNQTLEFLDGYIQTPTGLFIGGQQIIVPVPTLIVTVVNNSSLYMILQSPTDVIVLPTPEWGDTQEGGYKVDVKRSMTGKVYTYIQTAKWFKIHYDFTLSRIKALEFRAFLKKNMSNVLRMQNWKGEVFLGQVTVNPISFVTSGRYAPQYEKCTVAFDFEGVLLYG